jgi:predicted transcriptional regulator
MSEYIATQDLTPSLADDALITILPIHAHRIYDGSKVFELRKAMPRLVPRRMFLYETDGVSAITGHIVIDDVLVGSPEQLWKLTGERAAAKVRFDQYFHGRSLGYAYKIRAALRYAQPVSRSEALNIDPGFRVPQQFLYLQNLPSLRGRLRCVARNEGLDSVVGDLTLPRLTAAERSTFKKLVQEHISMGYLETGRAYAEKLLAISDGGEDPEGFLTTEKSVRTIAYKGKKIGFVVLTFKLGGSVKTGPVILDQRYRGKGVGKLLRKQLHCAATLIGYRKVFATVPADNVSAYSYLLSSGYRIEAHLHRPYHLEHDELVFGFLLDTTRGPGPEFIRQLTPLTAFERIDEPLPDVVTFLRSEFSSAYCRVAEGWAERQLELAKGAQESKFKPRLVFAAGNGHVLALCVCLLKRGGSAKLIVLTRTGHQPSLTAFLQFIEGEVRSISPSVRRLYTQVPAKDSDMIQSFVDLGCRPEGLIEQPFGPNSDTLILAKSLRDQRS